ncbi:MAG: hypothetical protein ACTSVG_04650, partial [Alphaproteobacteria bacterium]
PAGKPINTENLNATQPVTHENRAIRRASCQTGHSSRCPKPEPPAAPPQAPILGLDPIQVSLRITALEDILRDALIYERDILNRNR